MGRPQPGESLTTTRTEDSFAPGAPACQVRRVSGDRVLYQGPCSDPGSVGSPMLGGDSRLLGINLGTDGLSGHGIEIESLLRAIEFDVPNFVPWFSNGSQVNNRRLYTSLGAIGLGLAAGTLALIVRGQANHDYNEKLSKCMSGCSTGDVENSVRSIQRQDGIAIGGLVVGASLVLYGGASLYWELRDHRPSGERAALSVDPFGRTIALTWRTP